MTAARPGPATMPREDGRDAVGRRRPAPKAPKATKRKAPMHPPPFAPADGHRGATPDPAAIRATAARVIRTEAEALAVLARALPADFDAAVPRILGFLRAGVA